MSTIVNPQYNHPCGDLLDGKDYIDIAIPLYRASIAGDWDELATLIKDKDHRLRCSITKNKEIALHIAAMGKSTWFFKQIAKKMSKLEDMALQNGDGNTPLCLAAISGNTEMAKIILENDPSLLTTRGAEDMMPLCLAALHGNHDMVTFLYHELQQFPIDPTWSDNDWYQIFLKCIEADFFDVALEILNDHKNSVLTLQDKRCVGKVLHELAQKPNAFHDIPPPNAINYHIRQNPIIKRILNSALCVDKKPRKATQLLKKILEQIVIDLGHDIDDIFGDSYKILFAAAEIGNAKFLIELFHLFPDLMWKINDKRQTIFHIAVKYRHKSIYSLLYEIGSMKDMITRHIDNDGNNMLHLAAKLGEGNKSLEEFTGAAFQMRHEMLWFKDVEAMVPPSYKKMENKSGLTPQHLFTQEHQILRQDDEQCIKSTISQSMVAAALISTIGFSVAFSIPGGYNQNTGFPMFHRNKVFMTYVILDALSFISSSVSILIFLSITTFRYSEEDFLNLYNKWLLGQALLFLSIMAVMTAFGVSFFVTFGNKLPILISTLTYIPVVLFAVQQYQPLINAFRSSEPKKRMLYYKNPRF